MPSEVAAHMVVDPATSTYQPIVYPTDFWVLKKYMVPMNETLFEKGELNLTLNFQNYNVFYFQF